MAHSRAADCVYVCDFKILAPLYQVYSVRQKPCTAVNVGIMERRERRGDGRVSVLLFFPVSYYWLSYFRLVLMLQWLNFPDESRSFVSGFEVTYLLITWHTFLSGHWLFFDVQRHTFFKLKLYSWVTQVKTQRRTYSIKGSKHPCSLNYIFKFIFTKKSVY